MQFPEGLALLGIASCLLGIAPPSIAEDSPYLATASVGISHEKSSFPVLRLDNTASFQVQGQSAVEDTYKNASASLAINQACGSFACSAELSIDSHTGQASSEFNTQFARISAGIGAPFSASLPVIGGASWGVQALAEDWRVANEHFRTVTGGVLNLIWLDEAQNSTLITTEISRFKHTGENSMLDATYRLVSLSHDRKITPLDAELSLQLSHSSETNLAGERYLDNRADMARASITKHLLGVWQVAGALTYQRILFSHQDPLANRIRHDGYLGRELYVERSISEKMKLRAGWSDSTYMSNIALFENTWRSFDISLNVEF